MSASLFGLAPPSRSEGLGGRRKSSHYSRSGMLFMWSLLCITLLFSGPPGYPSEPDLARAQQQGPPPTTLPPEFLGQVGGRVLRADTAQPLAKAVVVLIPVADPVRGVSVRTDSAGRFQFVEVVPGTYRLRAQRNGFVTQVFGQRGSSPGVGITVNTSQRLENIDFRLERASVITGTVFDEDAEPVEGLLVHAVRLRFERGGRLATSVIRTTRTDDIGEYRLPGLSPGFYLVQAGGRGDTVSINLQAPPVSYGTTFYRDTTSIDDATRIQVTVGAIVRAIDLRVRSASTYAVSGVVVDSEATGTRRYSVGFVMRGGRATAPAQPDGSFEFHGIAAGDYTLMGSVSDESGATRRGYVKVKVVDSDVRVAIEIGRSAEVAGMARTDDGQDVAFQGLLLELAADEAEAASVTTPVDPSGEFAIRNVPAGNYTFQMRGREDEFYLKKVDCNGQEYSERVIALGPEEKISGCVLTLSRIVSVVTGRVLEGDKPADGMVVVLIPQDMQRRRNPRHTLITQSDDNGNFEVKGVVPGEYFAFALPPMDDAGYFDLGFAERNSEVALRITAKPGERTALRLSPIVPR